MMSHPIFRNTVSITVMRQDGLLPLAEAIERFVSMMVYLQVGLQSGNNRISHEGQLGGFANIYAVNTANEM